MYYKRVYLVGEREKYLFIRLYYIWGINCFISVDYLCMRNERGFEMFYILILIGKF